MGRPRELTERLFFLTMAVAVLVTVFIGFAPSYYLAAGRPRPTLVHVHALVFSAWVLTFLLQSTLITARRVDLHVRVGVFGACLALAMLVVGPLTALRGAGTSTAGLSFLAVQLVDIVVFAGLVAAALLCRDTPQTHKRLMLLATVSLLSPATGRMPWPPWLGERLVNYGIPDLFVVPLLIWDLVTLRRVHPATLLGVMWILGAQVLREALRHTDAWLRLAAWLTAPFA